MIFGGGRLQDCQTVTVSPLVRLFTAAQRHAETHLRLFLRNTENDINQFQKTIFYLKVWQLEMPQKIA